jgi:chromosome segregation ATPase
MATAPLRLSAEQDKIQTTGTGASSTISFAAQRMELLQNQISSMKEELARRDNAYNDRKIWLNESALQHESQYQREKQVFQQKLEALMEEAKWQHQQWDSDVTELDASWQIKWKDLQESLATTQQAIAQEQTSRAKALAGMDQQFEMRDNEFEGLLDIVSQHGDDLKLAQQERDDLKKELKNVLVTVNVQFEHLMCLTSKQADEISVLREERCHALDKVAVVHAELDLTRSELAQLQQDYSKVSDEIQTQCKVAWIGQEDLLDEVQSLSNSLESAASEVSALRSAQEADRQAREEDHDRLVDSESKLRRIEAQLKQSSSQMKHLQEDLKLAQANKDELQTSLAQLVWQCEQSVEQQAVVNTKHKEKYEKHKENLRIVCTAVESSTEQIANLEQQAMQLRQDQESDQTQLQSWGATMEESKEQMSTLQQQVEEQCRGQESMQAHLSDALQRAQSDIGAATHRLDALHAKLDTQLKFVQRREEAQSLRSKDFSTKHADMERQLAEWNQRITKWEQVAGDRQERELPTALSAEQQASQEAATKILVEGILQPWLSQLRSVEDSFQRQGQQLAQTTADTHAIRQANEKVTLSVESANKTWESLFQHLAGQVQQDASAMMATKQQSEAMLRDIQSLASAWTMTLDKFEAPRVDLTTLVQGHKLGMDALQAKIDETNTHMASLTDQLAKQQAHQSSFQHWQAQLQAQINQLEESSEERSYSQAKGNVDEAFKMAMRTDLKIEKWRTAFVKHAHQAELDVMELRTAIQNLSLTAPPAGSLMGNNNSDSATMPTSPMKKRILGPEKVKAFQSALGLQESQVLTLEQELIRTNECWQQSKYENSSLRLQLLGLSKEDKSQSATHRPVPLETVDEQREE